MKRLRQWLRLAPVGDAAAPDATRVLMVCMGNICRSPTAEGVLREKLRRAGLGGQVLVDSAGTHGFHSGEAPDPRAVRAAAQRGYQLATLRARPVQPEDFLRFHWVLAMDEANLAWLQDRAPENATASLGLLMAHARRHTDVREVPDPYYGAPAGFERVLDFVEDACDGLLQRLASERAQHQPAAAKGD